MEKGALQTVLDEMEAAGYVRKTEEMRPRRDGVLAPVYRLTDLGEAVAQAEDVLDIESDGTLVRRGEDGEPQARRD